MFVDDNIPREAGQWLSKKGFELTSVSQTYLKSAKDHAIAEYAIKNNLTIIALDNHFSQNYRMLKNDQLTVIIIKANPATPMNIIKTLDIAQQKIDLKDVSGKLVIISKKRIRIIT